MTLVYLHLGLMTAAAAAMIGGVIVARYFKQKKWWLKLHKSLNLSAVTLALVGFSVAFVMVGSSGGPHFRVPHALAGLAALLALLAVPALGFAIFKTKEKEKVTRLKLVHRFAGKAVIVLMIAAALAGYSLIGII